jgi:hypothetical protein
MKHPIMVVLALSILIISKAQDVGDSSNTHPASPNLIHDSTKYATLYVYRERNMMGSMFGYDLHEEDSVICRVKNNSKFIIKLYKEGPTEIWAKTEKKVAVHINVQFGKEYYIKCGVKPGWVEGRPQLDVVYAEQGKLDFANIEGRDHDKTEENN